jgi:hypothetical protein
MGMLNRNCLEYRDSENALFEAGILKDAVGLVFLPNGRC